MELKYSLQEIDDKIKIIKETAEQMVEMSDDFPSLYRNSRRILASIKMLEINISDLNDLIDN
jgi:hypothetical protein